MGNSDKQPVLFVLIGWARRYDGTEAVVGGHKYLADNPKDNAEAQAFLQQDDGKYNCGAGRGEVHEMSVDVVFVARHPVNREYEVVGIYRAATPHPDGGWCTLSASSAQLFAIGQRPQCLQWPAGQGMRRWARRQRSTGASHKSLLVVYQGLHVGTRRRVKHAVDENDIELAAFEGQQRRLFVIHRKREAKLRAAKIRQALESGHGHLKCEVHGCGFDFLKTYGEIGRNFAVVHHLKPLASLSGTGGKTSLKDLAVVCPNCHAMIHRDGQCRSLKSILKKR